MKDFLFLIFNELGYDSLYFRQGTMLPVVEPDSFFTYWNINNTDEYSDNVPLVLTNTYQVYFYCKESNLITDANYLENKMKQFTDKARQYGLAVSGLKDFASGLDGYLSMMCRVDYAQHE